MGSWPTTGGTFTWVSDATARRSGVSGRLGGQFDGAAQEAEVDGYADGEQVGGGTGGAGEDVQGGQVYTGALDRVERLPGAPGRLVVLHAYRRGEPLLPGLRGGEAAAADQGEVGPVLGGVADVGELPVDDRGHPRGVLQRVARAGVAVHDDRRPGGPQVDRK